MHTQTLVTVLCVPCQVVSVWEFFFNTCKWSWQMGDKPTLHSYSQTVYHTLQVDLRILNNDQYY